MFTATREYSEDDVTLLRKMQDKQAYDKRRISFGLSADAYEYFGVGNWYRKRWQNYFLPPESYRDLRPRELKQDHRMFEVGAFSGDNTRKNKTTVVLRDEQRIWLVELWLALDVYNEPNVAITHMVAITLEAIAAGYLEIIKDED